MRSHLTKYIGLGLLLVFISSCANIEITKRRYRPGYHVDVVKKNDRNVKVDESVVMEKAPEAKPLKETDTKLAKVNAKKAERVGKRDARRARAELKSTDEAPLVADIDTKSGVLDVKPFEDVDKKTRESAFTFQKNRMQNKLRNAIRPPSEDKAGWSVVSFIAFGLGIAAFVMFLFTLATLVGILSGGGVLTPVWIFGLVTLLLGIGGMITGIIGLRDTRDKRGRGFALAGMISGILGLVFGLIFFLWGLIFDVILDEQI